LQTFTLKQAPCIEVIDNGAGISHEHIKHLFEPFFTTSASGNGLGLYISRELAELNQAKLSYHLTAEKRSCFRLCLLDADDTTIEI
jgi:two-component system sensor histidine kinase PilS (NtrC family)